MTATVVGSNRWFQDLTRGQIYHKSFQIPPDVRTSCKVAMNSKRNVKVVLSSGCVLTGYATVSSGTELHFPTDLQEYIRGADWFVAEILDNSTSTM